ncbi:thioesterase-like superfamily-domain-containing protein [Aspergillus germanicus]
MLVLMLTYISYKGAYLTSLSQALDFNLTPSCTPQISVQFSSDVAFGSVCVGGYVASAMTKYALHYASYQPQLQDQVDLHSAVFQFYRPVFPTSVITMPMREVHIGKAMSTLRVELSQEDKISCSAELVITDPSIKGITLQTGWHLSPEARQVDLAKLATDSDPNWTSYHCAFYPDGFRRGHSYAKTHIPRTWPAEISFLEQWVEPGWGCLPQGSRPSDSNDNARWTNEMLHFVADMALPIQENFLPHEDGQPLPMGSIAAMLAFAARQQTAREQWQRNWRALPDDGSREWLYLRTGCKRIVDGRMDLKVLVVDERMGLIAISHQTVVLVPAAAKIRKE